jgi:hypothetical protein
MFTQASAASVATSSTAALPVCVRRKLRSGVSRCRTHAVRSRERRRRIPGQLVGHLGTAWLTAESSRSGPPGRIRAGRSTVGHGRPIIPRTWWRDH